MLTQAVVGQDGMFKILINKSYLIILNDINYEK